MAVKVRLGSDCQVINGTKQNSALLPPPFNQPRIKKIKVGYSVDEDSRPTPGEAQRQRPGRATTAGHGDAIRPSLVF
jgi:hypothetical protein